MPLTRTIPALPVRDVAAAVEVYVERFGFTATFAEPDFAVLQRDAAVLHLWRADDESWPARADLSSRPVRSGAESFLAGTASCRIELDTVADLQELCSAYGTAGVLHKVSRAGTTTTDFGTREFHAVDRDGNLLGFFVWAPGSGPRG